MNKIRGLDKLEALRETLPGASTPTSTAPPDPKDVALDALIDLWVAVSKHKTDVPLPVRSALEKVNRIIRPLLHE